jgi:hypothetical protein
MRFPLREGDISGSIPPRVKNRGILETVMKRLIVIPFNIPWEWSTDYTNQTAFELAKQNIVICYMWGDSFTIKEYIQKAKIPVLIKRLSKNEYLYYPILFIPFRRFKKIVDINQQINLFFLKILAKLLSVKNNISKIILWIFDPRLYPLSQKFGEDYFLLYDCVDFFHGTARTEEEKKLLIKYEHRLTKKAGLVTANSIVLLKHLQKIRKDIHLVPQGFRYQKLNSTRSKHIDLNLEHPIIGYVGGVNNRLDTTLLLRLIKNNISWNFVLWGPIQKYIPIGPNKLYQISEILNLPNVFSGESGDKKEIPGIISQFDVGIIPYDISQDFNKYCYPMKLFEYFYLGKPVVSTKIIELKRYPNFVKIGKNYNDWEKIIKKLISKPWAKKYKKQERVLAIENIWENKVTKIIDLIPSRY